MNKFLKILGTTALIAGLTPYRVEKNKETGEYKVKALLWQASKKPGANEEKDTLTVKFFTFGREEEEEETHIFSDELTVDYSGRTEDGKPEDKDWEEAVESAEAMAAESASAGEPAEDAEEPEQPTGE